MANAVRPLSSPSPRSTPHSLRRLVLVITNDDLKDSFDSDPPDDSPDWDEFGDPNSASASASDDHDPGSWRPIIEPSSLSSNSSSSDDPREALYLSSVRTMISAASSSDPTAMDFATFDIEATASAATLMPSPPSPSSTALASPAPRAAPSPSPMTTSQPRMATCSPRWSSPTPTSVRT